MGAGGWGEVVRDGYYVLVVRVYLCPVAAVGATCFHLVGLTEHDELCSQVSEVDVRLCMENLQMFKLSMDITSSRYDQCRSILPYQGSICYRLHLQTGALDDRVVIFTSSTIVSRVRVWVSMGIKITCTVLCAYMHACSCKHSHVYMRIA